MNKVQQQQSTKHDSSSMEVTTNGEKCIPKHFCCPITLEVMVNPVIDREGNTYEQDAILSWLQNQKSSPMSREPLAAEFLVPNIALREAIHDFMGPEWVMKHPPSQALKKKGPIIDDDGRIVHECQYRFVIEVYLADISRRIGKTLQLNEQGVCAFTYEAFTVVIEVPKNIGSFHIYTYEVVPNLSNECKDIILELNYLQQQTRGGCISVTKLGNNGENDLSEVIFSYTDRVLEVTSYEFCNLLENFVNTTVDLHRRIFNNESITTSLSPSSLGNNRIIDPTDPCGMSHQ